MNDLLRDKLQIIANDELLLKAIKAVFDERIEKERPQIFDEDNQKLGEKFRAYETSRNIIEQSFADLMSYKISKTSTKSFNKAK